MSPAPLNIIHRLWNGLRTILGDDAYDRYLAHVSTHHSGTSALSRAEFYKADQDRRWSGINRCC